MRLGAAAAAVGVCGLAYGAPQLFRRRNLETQAHRCRDRRAVVLTYDDGPSRAATPELLDLLARYDAAATFFALGRAIERETALIARIRAEGHELATHGEAHVHPLKSDPIRLAIDTWTGCRRLDAEARWFRPTYGKLTLGNYVPARALGQYPQWWTLDSGDTHANPPDPKAVVASIRAAEGGVVLLHDMERSRDRVDLMLAITEGVLDMVQADGFEAVTLGDLLGSNPACA